MSKVIRVPAEIPASGRRVAYAEIPISDVVVTVEIDPLVTRRLVPTTNQPPAPDVAGGCRRPRGDPHSLAKHNGSLIMITTRSRAGA